MKKLAVRWSVGLLFLLGVGLAFNTASATDQLSVRYSKFKTKHPLDSIYIDNSGQRCKEFVKDFYSSVFLIDVPSTVNNYDLDSSSSLTRYSQLVYSGSDFTAEDVKNAINGAEGFSIIQMYVTTSGGTTTHTAMIERPSDDSFVMYDANWVPQYVGENPNPERNKIQAHTMKYTTLAGMINFQGGGFTVYYGSIE